MKRLWCDVILLLVVCAGALMGQDADFIKLYVGDKVEGIELEFVPRKFERSRNDVASVVLVPDRKTLVIQGNGIGICNVSVYGDGQMKKVFQVKVIKDLRPLARRLDGRLQELGNNISATSGDEKVVVEGTLKTRRKWEQFQKLMRNDEDFRNNRHDIDIHVRIDCQKEVMDSLQKILSLSNFRLVEKEAFERNRKQLKEANPNERFQVLAALVNSGYIETKREDKRTDIFFRAYVSSEKQRKDILERWRREIRMIPEEAQMACHDDIEVHVVDPESLVAELAWQLKDKGLEVVDKPVENEYDKLWIEKRLMEFGSVAVLKGTVLNDQTKKEVEELVAGVSAKIKQLGNVGALDVRSEIKTRVEMLDISLVYVAMTESEVKEFGNVGYDGTLFQFDLGLNSLVNTLKGKTSVEPGSGSNGRIRSWSHTTQSQSQFGAGINGAIRFFKSNGVDRMREAGHLRFRSDGEASVHKGGTVIMQLQGDNPTVHEINYGVQINASSVVFEGKDKLKMMLKYEYSNQPSGELMNISDKFTVNQPVTLTLGKTLVTNGMESQNVFDQGPSGLAGARKVPVLNWLAAEEIKQKEKLHLFLLIHPRILTDENSGELIEVSPLDQKIYYEMEDPDPKPKAKKKASGWKFWKR